MSDERETMLRRVRIMMWLSAGLFVGDCIVALILDDRASLYNALPPLFALILGTAILRWEGEK